MELLGEVTDLEWAEMFHVMGERIALRKAAADVPLRVQRATLLREIARLREDNAEVCAGVCVGRVIINREYYSMFS